MVLFSSKDRSFYFEQGKEVHLIRNVLISGGADKKLIAWKICVQDSGNKKKYEVSFNYNIIAGS